METRGTVVTNYHDDHNKKNEPLQTDDKDTVVDDEEEEVNKSWMQPPNAEPRLMQLPEDSKNLRGRASGDRARNDAITDKEEEEEEHHRQLFKSQVNGIPVNGFKVLARSASKCLVGNGSINNMVNFVKCDGSNDGQQWVFTRTTGHTIPSKPKLTEQFVFRNVRIKDHCLEATTSSNQVRLAPCNGNSDYQKWLVNTIFDYGDDDDDNTTASPFTSLVSRANTNMCLAKTPAGDGVEQQECVSLPVRDDEKVRRQLWLFSKPDRQGFMTVFEGNKCIIMRSMISTGEMELVPFIGCGWPLLQDFRLQSPDFYRNSTNDHISSVVDYSNSCWRTDTGITQPNDRLIMSPNEQQCDQKFYYWKGKPEYNRADPYYQQRPGLIYMQNKQQNGALYCLYHTESNKLLFGMCEHKDKEREYFDVMYY